MEWRVVFWIMAMILVATNFVYLFIGSGELQPWNEPEPKPDTDLECRTQPEMNGKHSNGDSRDSYKERTI